MYLQLNPNKLRSRRSPRCVLLRDLQQLERGQPRCAMRRHPKHPDPRGKRSPRTRAMLAVERLDRARSWQGTGGSTWM